MENLIIDYSRYRRTIRYWWVTLLLGIASFILGIVVFNHPGESYFALTVIFGILILISGVAQLIIGAYAPKGSGRGWLIAEGVIETLLGLILVFNIGMSAIILPLFLGFWLLFRGLTMIGLADDMRDAGIRGTGWTIFWAILLMLAAFAILILPAVGIGAIVIWIGISFLLAGVAMIFFSIYLAGQRKYLD